jgi:hypothetical protein
MVGRTSRLFTGLYSFALARALYFVGIVTLMTASGPMACTANTGSAPAAEDGADASAGAASAPAGGSGGTG